MFDLLREEEPQAYKQASYCWHSGNFPIYEHCEVTYFPLGELKFQALIDELKESKTLHIFRIFYYCGRYHVEYGTGHLKRQGKRGR